MLPNQRGLLKPGMFLTVRLTRGASDALLVPEQALVPEQGDVFVFVVEDGHVEKRQVRTGERRVGEVQVVEGLADGERVVIEGTQKLRDGVAVTVKKAAPAQVDNDPRDPTETVGVSRSSAGIRDRHQPDAHDTRPARSLAAADARAAERRIADRVDRDDYLGASADVVETKITQVIEDRVAGIEGVTKITSQSVDGRSSIDLEFDADRTSTRRRTTCAIASRGSPATCPTRPTRPRSARPIPTPSRSCS